MSPPSDQSDAQWMQHALRLAAGGRGAVEPNPMVGCVIVRDRKLIAEGRHEKFGGPHAEANAMAACNHDCAGASVYVTLEPCCHENKKTPPCVPALIAARVSRVIVGCLDPNPVVRGNGVEQLRAAAISVQVGVLEAECKQLNAAYFASTLHRRPYVTLKWAQSSDGKIAGPHGKRRTIANPASLRAVHQLRARCDAIMVGIRTVLLDDPLLTARDVPTTRPLLRCVLDTNLSFSPECKLAGSLHAGPVVVYCSHRTFNTRAAAVAALRARRIELVPVPAEGDQVSLPNVLADLHTRSVTHLLVEPGPTLAASFQKANLADRVWRFVSASPIADAAAPAAAEMNYPAVAEINLDGDRLTEHLNPASDAYFAAQASADMGMVAPQAHG